LRTGASEGAPLSRERSPRERTTKTIVDPVPSSSTAVLGSASSLWRKDSSSKLLSRSPRSISARPDASLMRSLPLSIPPNAALVFALGYEVRRLEYHMAPSAGQRRNRGLRRPVGNDGSEGTRAAASHMQTLGTIGILNCTGTGDGVGALDVAQRFELFLET
jgi:hypothetical protein